MTKRFFLIQDHTVREVWDGLIGLIPTFPTKPQGFERPDIKLPEGDWTLGCGLWTIASDSAYQKVGIPKPFAAELPVIFCVDGASVRRRDRVSTEEAAAFIKENL